MSEKNDGKPESKYVEVDFSVAGQNISLLGLTKWNSPDGALTRVYVNGRPAGKGKVQWAKLGWISADRENVEWGNMGEVPKQLVRNTVKEILAEE